MGFNWSMPNSRKSSLPAHHALANFQNGLLPLLDVLHELDGGSVAFFHVIPTSRLGSCVAIEHLAVLRIQAKLRNVLIVNADQVILAVFGNVNVRLHLARARTGVAQAGPRIQMLDHVDGDLDVLEGTLQQPGDFLELAQFHQFQMIVDHVPGHAALAAAAFELQQQAFPQIDRAHAGRVQRMDHAQRLP